MQSLRVAVQATVRSAPAVKLPELDVPDPPHTFLQTSIIVWPVAGAGPNWHPGVGDDSLQMQQVRLGQRGHRRLAAAVSSGRLRSAAAPARSPATTPRRPVGLRSVTAVLSMGTSLLECIVIASARPLWKGLAESINAVNVHPGPPRSPVSGGGGRTPGRRRVASVECGATAAQPTPAGAAPKAPPHPRADRATRTRVLNP